jgi:hypothetical protein
MLYRGMDRTELDAAYNNSAAVPERDAIIADWTARSATVRHEHAAHLDLPYGRSPRERLDLFLAANPKAPTLAFMHRGYWQMNEMMKENFAFSPRACCRSGSISHSLNTRWLRRRGSTGSSPRCAAPSNGCPSTSANTGPIRHASISQGFPLVAT